MVHPGSQVASHPAVGQPRSSTTAAAPGVHPQARQRQDAPSGNPSLWRKHEPILTPTVFVGAEVRRMLSHACLICWRGRSPHHGFLREISKAVSTTSMTPPSTCISWKCFPSRSTSIITGESPPQPPLTKSQLTGCQGDENQLLMRVVHAESQQLTNEKRIHWADRVELQADRAGAIRGAPLKASAVQK
jgi:hypothetical protein